MIYKSVMKFAILIILIINTQTVSADTNLSIFQLIHGTDKCIWEPKSPGSFVSRPDMQSVSSCEQYAAEQNYSFTGSGDDAWIEANKEPTEACTCGMETEKWFFYEPWNEYKCSGFRYTCTKPGAGCRWVKTGSSTINIESSMECRTKANECGVYYGWNEKEEASKKPETNCVCGETRIQWYSENNTSTNWQFVCKAIEYKCLAPLKIKKKFPDKFNP